VSTLFTLAWVRGAAERAIKTAAQSLLAVLGVGGLGILDIDWAGTLSVAALAGLTSILTSVASPDFVAGTPTSSDEATPDQA
jgi:Putative lactococcus lactis phage r1t holin